MKTIIVLPIPGIENFKPKKILRSSPSLEIPSTHRYEASIQSGGLLSTKYCRFFLLPWWTYRGLRGQLSSASLK